MAWRILSGIGLVLILFITAALVRFQLQVLDVASNASAVQVAQVHTEAQTVLMGSILLVLIIIAFGVLFPRPTMEMRAPSQPERVSVPRPQSSTSSESS